MGSAHQGGGGGSNGGCGGGCSSSSSATENMNSWLCRWKYQGHNGNKQGRRLMFSSGFVFLFVSFVVYGLIGWFYCWLLLVKPYNGGMVGCREDGEGSWSVGVFFGDSPFSLQPIENVLFILCLIISRELNYVLILSFLIDAEEYMEGW